MFHGEHAFAQPESWISRGSHGGPLVLVKLSFRDSAPPAPVEIRNLRVAYRARCRIEERGRSETGTYALVECRSEEPELQRQFLEVGIVLLEALTASPTELRLERLVEELIELFRSVGMPGRSTVEGLWGELFLLVSARSPQTLLPAWHNEPSERFDFASGLERLEVKTCMGARRLHQFSLEQTRTPGLAVAVVSIRVEPVGAGQTVRELADELAVRLERPELLLKLYRVIYSTLGKDWGQARLDRFDRIRALESVRYYVASNIPSVSEDMPPQVSQVRFASDLTEQPPLTPAEMQRGGPLWVAALLA